MKASYLNWLFWFSFIPVNAKGSSNLLKGRHVVMGLPPFPVSLEVIRNSSGHIVDLDGITFQGIVWLSQRLQFTYSYLQVNDTKIEGQGGDFRGLTYYLLRGECDMIPGLILMSNSRLEYMDFTSGYHYSPGVLLIKKPNPSTNIASLVKPFQAWVWFLVFVAILAVIVALYVFKKVNYSRCGVCESNNRSETSLNGNISLIETLLCVFGILLSQGGKIYKKANLKYQLIAAVWCLSAFVLVSAYNCRLISYIMAPNIQALVDSSSELADKPDVFPVVDKGLGFELALMTAKDGIIKKLGDKLRSRPISRCPTPKDCVELIKSGPYAYMNVMYAALKVMRDDYLSTKQCNIILAKKTDSPSPTGWAFPKSSPYLTTIALGLSEIYDYGFVEIWTRWYQPDVRQCLHVSSKFEKTQARLTLRNLTGAFIVLIVGILSSLIAFLCEIMLKSGQGTIWFK